MNNKLLSGWDSNPQGIEDTIQQRRTRLTNFDTRHI